MHSLKRIYFQSLLRWSAKKAWISQSKLNRLEEIVKRLESGDLSLEESLLKFEEGIKLARELETVLARADSRVQEILKPSGELEK